MARITVADCSTKINDRFKLVVLAAQRAKDINSGSDVTISNDKADKPTVIALREIANGNVMISSLTAELLRRFRVQNNLEPVDDEITEDVATTIAENFDYLPNGADIFVNEDYSDLDDQIFQDIVSDE